MIRLVLADDHVMLRQGLASLLNEQANMKVVAEANNGNEVLDILSHETVDVLLLDIEMPGMDGFDTLREIRKLQIPPRVLVLTMHKSPQFLKNIFSAGANGYLPKDSGKKVLVEAILTLHSSGSFHTPETMKMVMDGLKASKKSAGISQREKEIIQLIADQHTTSEIAEKLFLSTHTVESHRKNILLKLGLKNSAGLVKYAIHRGLI
ncbi:response regulator transcription factor [Flagellimonas allohymeniacidonis]|uniref:Response regulator transcription factor n=1 Tax=Flagellimonas allohymeniacidonis TaxID=2517819 RepID=A0A4V2HST8_9FLAO|nr:response regulator transcription factor [Allomuricauda hymeniacidonis]TAI49010.1 response regulator transcription factor [Allomuricauda hymeniacidonis]